MNLKLKGIRLLLPDPLLGITPGQNTAALRGGFLLLAHCPIKSCSDYAGVHLTLLPMKENHDIRAIVTQQGNRFQISCIFVQIPQHRRIIVQPLARFASAWYWLTVFVVICSIALRDDKGLPTVVANPIHLNHRFCLF